MTYGYNEQEGIAFQQDVIACYREANQTPDLLNVVWSNRMTYDAHDLGYPASRAKHLRELRVELGAPARGALYRATGSALRPQTGTDRQRDSRGGGV